MSPLGWLHFQEQRELAMGRTTLRDAPIRSLTRCCSIGMGENEMDVEECPKCKGSGEIAIDARTCRYVAPGPVPDDAKGVISSTCFTCAGMGYVECQEGE